MKNNAYIPYYFNLKYEYRTYKNIGEEYKIQYKAKKNVLYKLYWLIRKVFNWNEKKYKNLNKFSEWEEYINHKSLGDVSNKKDFIHFLEGKARNSDLNRNIIGSIVTPIYVILISGGLTILLIPAQTTVIQEHILSTWLFFSLLLLFMLIFLIENSYRRNMRYNFYRDYIKLIEKQEKDNLDTSHQK